MELIKYSLFFVIITVYSIAKTVYSKSDPNNIYDLTY